MKICRLNEKLWIPRKPTDDGNTKKALTSGDENITCVLNVFFSTIDNRERSGSVVECLTRDGGATGSSLTGVTALCP